MKKTMTENLISVIMPVYNAEHYMEEAIQSVLCQTYSQIELICVNDYSSDNSKQILEEKSSQLTILNNTENLGIGATRNKGIQESQGEFIAFLDADDIWDINKLSFQIQEFNKDPCLDICFSYMKCFLSPDLSEELKQSKKCPPDPMVGIIPTTALIKRKVFDQVGLFDPKWRVGEFIDWFSKAKEMNISYKVIDNVFLLRRIHGTNTSANKSAQSIDYMRIIRESLARKKYRSQ